MTAPETESRPEPLALDPARTALVLVDLMDRIVGLPVEPRRGTRGVQEDGRAGVHRELAEPPRGPLGGERPCHQVRIPACPCLESRGW